MSVLVILEQQGGKWNRMSWETLAAGQQFASSLGQPLEAAVIGLAHPKWDERPIAYAVPKPEFKGQVTQEEVIEFLKDKVAKWWLPDEVRFIDEVPKTSVGKFDKKVLRASAVPISAGVKEEAKN